MRDALSLIFVTGCLVVSIPALAVMVDIQPQTVFVPNGFDNNDEVVVVADGYLPDSCHRLTAPEIKIDRAKKQIMVQTRANSFEGVCNDMTVPFYSTIRLGYVPKGEFNIVNRQGQSLSGLRVVQATTSYPDDYLYAPVDTVSVETKADKAIATLKGRFTNTCLSIDSVKTTHSGNTIEVLPIMKVEDGEGTGRQCEVIEKEFSQAVELNVDKGRHLLHVRSLNGQSVNHLFTMQ